MAALRAPMVTGGSGPPQKFGLRSFFFGHLLSRNWISQKIWAEPPPLTVDISDHLAILTTLSLGTANQIRERVRVNSEKNNIKQRQFSEANNLEFKNLIGSENWSYVYAKTGAEA